MQAAAQKWVDSSISKTINCPEDISFEAFKDVYMQAWDMGCKGCTTYRPNEVTGSVLSVVQDDTSKLPELQTQSERLTWAAQKAGFDKKVDLARATGLSQQFVGQQINGTREISKDAAAKFSEVLGISAGWLVFGESSAEALSLDGAELRHPHSDVVYIAEPLDRPQELEGHTYKLKWPDSNHAIYITINDIVIAGHRRPFEIFINSKNMEHYAWTVALTRMISAVFRRGGDVSFVVEELKAVFDPRGGAWMGGKYVPSILAAIGGVIERHLIAIGFIGGEGMGLKNDPQAQVMEMGARPASPACPNCGEHDMRMIEGCMTCASCAYSKCG